MFQPNKGPHSVTDITQPAFSLVQVFLGMAAAFAVIELFGNLKRFFRPPPRPPRICQVRFYDADGFPLRRYSLESPYAFRLIDELERKQEARPKSN